MIPYCIDFPKKSCLLYIQDISFQREIEVKLLKRTTTKKNLSVREWYTRKDGIRTPTLKQFSRKKEVINKSHYDHRTAIANN